MSIKWIFWDNDGVLVNTEHLYFQTTQAAMANLGIQIDLEIYCELLLKQAKGTWHLALEAGVEKGNIERAKLWRDEQYAKALDNENINMPNSKDVVRQSAEYGMKMGIVTSSMKHHFEIIHRSKEFLNYMEFVLTNGDYTHSKPDPAPYLKALQLAKCKKEEALVIEDSERGLNAAHAAGLKCWVVPTELSKDQNFTNAEQVLSNITEIPHLLKREVL